MVKKSKSSGSEIPVHHSNHHINPEHHSVSIEARLIANLIELQKVHTNLAEKFDSLSKQISALLELFESAAHSFAQTPGNISAEKDKEFLNKVDKLLEQNKVLAKGLTLMEEKMRGRVVPTPQAKPLPSVYQPSQQYQPQQSSVQEASFPEDEFRPSLSSRPLPRI